MNTTPTDSTHAPGIPVMLKTREQVEAEIARRVAEERARLQARAGLRTQVPSHFQRPAERPFTAAERDKVTILIGGLTWKHEWLIKSVFEAAGYQDGDHARARRAGLPARARSSATTASATRPTSWWAT
jgi:hypothetical protein